MNQTLQKRLNNIFQEPDELTIMTHANCMDGVGSVIAVAAAFKKEPSDLNIIYLQYGKDFSSIINQKYKNVLMIDFSFTKKQLLQLDSNCDNLVVIDHHKTAEQELKNLDFTIFDMNESGATLAWKTLTDKPVPILLQYIKDRDLWQWELPNSREVSAALQVIGIRNTNEIIKHLNNVEELIEQGDAIIKYQQQYIDNVMHRFTNIESASFIEYENQAIPFVNTTTLISEVGNVLSKHYPFAIMYFFTNDSLVLSFRSNNENKLSMDVSKIAKKFGGGGHKNAAGCTFRLNENTTILTNLFIKKVL